MIGFVSSLDHTASGTNLELGGSDGNMDNVNLAHSLGMGVFCISPNDKDGKLYKPSKVGHEHCCRFAEDVLLPFVADWLRSSVHTVRNHH